MGSDLALDLEKIHAARRYDGAGFEIIKLTNRSIYQQSFLLGLRLKY